MPVIAIVGAGPGLGLSVARVFGRHGFRVALIARSAERLSGLVTELAAEGVEAAAFPADAADPAALAAALEAAAAQLGPIEVLEVSPLSGIVPIAPSELTVETLTPQLGEVLFSSIAATNAVLPGMRERGSGTLLYTVGIGVHSPIRILGAINTAQAALRNWALNLHGELAEEGIHAGVVAIGVGIVRGAEPGSGRMDPDAIAERYWELHERREPAEITIAP